MKSIISSTLYLIALLCLSVFVFDPTKLYFEIPWLDIPMHIMGGFGVASLILAISSYRKHTPSLFLVLSLYLVVAVGWELYEVVKDTINNSSLNGWSDTFSDTINGGVGVLIAYYVFKK